MWAPLSKPKPANLRKKGFAAYRRVLPNYAQVSVPVSVSRPTGRTFQQLPLEPTPQPPSGPVVGVHLPIRGWGLTSRSSKRISWVASLAFDLLSSPSDRDPYPRATPGTHGDFTCS